MNTIKFFTLISLLSIYTGLAGMGAMPQYVFGTGRTPSEELLEYAKAGMINGVQQALRNGANINYANRFGKTALMLAIDCREDDIRQIQQKGMENNMRTIFTEIANVPCEKMIKFLLEKGADPNKQDRDGFTALKLAKKRGYTPIVNILIRYGASPTPLILGK